ERREREEDAERDAEETACTVSRRAIVLSRERAELARFFGGLCDARGDLVLHRGVGIGQLAEKHRRCGSVTAPELPADHRFRREADALLRVVVVRPRDERLPETESTLREERVDTLPIADRFRELAFELLFQTRGFAREDARSFVLEEALDGFADDLGA